MRLSEVMTTAVEMASPSEPAETAFERMERQAIHHLIVVDDGAVRGIVSHRDVGGRSGDSVRKDRTVADLMSDHVVVAKPSTTVREAANLLRGRSIGCLPVMKGRTLVGIVTTTDLLELLGRGAMRPVSPSRRETASRRSRPSRAASAR